MHKKDIAIVAIRLLAIYIIIMAISALPHYLGMFLSLSSSDAFGKSSLLGMLAASLVHILIGFGLWFYSQPIATLVIKDLPEDIPANTESRLNNIQSVAVSILGLFVLSSAIPSMAKLIVIVISPSSSIEYGYSIDALGRHSNNIPFAELAKQIVSFCLGLWFFFGSRGIVAFIKTIWGKGKSF
jgi:hypothetical protein